MDNPQQTQQAEVEYSPIKTIFLGAIFVALSLIFGYTLKGLILNGNLTSLIYLGIALLGFLSFFSLQPFFVKSFQIGALIVFLGTLALVGMFYQSISLLLAAAGLVTFLIFLGALGAGQAEIKNVLKIRFSRVAKTAISRASTALALFAVVLFMSSINLTNTEFSRKALDLLVKPAGPIVGSILGIKNFSIDRPLGEVISQALPQEIQGLPPALKTQATNEVIKKLEQTISGFVSVGIKSSDTLADIIYNATFAKLALLPKMIQNLILVGLGLLLFLTIKSMLFFVNFVVWGIAFVLYKLLFLLGFFHVTLEGRAKETIVLN